MAEHFSWQEGHHNRDRDGVPGQAIELCAKSAGADVVFSSTECFV